MKVIRILIYEGQEKFIKQTLKNSLMNGEDNTIKIGTKNHITSHIVKQKINIGRALDIIDNETGRLKQKKKG